MGMREHHKALSPDRLDVVTGDGASHAWLSPGLTVVVTEHARWIIDPGGPHVTRYGVPGYTGPDDRVPRQILTGQTHAPIEGDEWTWTTPAPIEDAFGPPRQVGVGLVLAVRHTPDLS